MPKAIMRSVGGITCGDCRQAVESAVGAVPGVSVAEVDVHARTVAVLYDFPAFTDSIDEAIQIAGYKINHRSTRRAS
ncbi:cation transporter (plasmid) [Streptomyces sp. NBC_00637]|uniref:heavy-metal-associated domain-containing protein n=1 Tax=Streptomyces sp. NBC_00637 TaxID=2903667 RepID=UPI002F914993